MKQSQRWNTLQICPHWVSNMGGSDLWSNTLSLDHGGTPLTSWKTKSTRSGHLGYQFFWPWITAKYFCYLCIRKDCMKERISCIDKTHHPHKFRALLKKNAAFWFTGATKAMWLEQLPCDEHHRGCVEQATAWGYTLKYRHASLMIWCVAKTVTDLHHMELLLENGDLL